MEKICKECGKLLDISCFTKSKNTKDGYENKCKKCRQEQRKKYIRTCVVCGTQFKTEEKDAQHCSHKCLAESRKNKIKYKCDGCGKEIEIAPNVLKKRKHVFCSYECYIKNIEKCRHKKGKKLYIKVCKTCGKQFKTVTKTTKYCSSKCIPHAPRKRITVKCFICGKEKEIVPSDLKHAKHFYCSEECKNKGYSLLYAGENSPIFSQITVTCEICGKNFKIKKSKYGLNKHIYCSRKCKNKAMSKYYSRENNHNWNPNLSMQERIVGRSYPEYTEWRKKVFERDNYTCQCCGDDKGHNLRAHHILNYSEHKESRIEPSNGITLCKKCHKKFHDTYGYTRNNIEQLKKFFKSQNSKNQLAISDTQETKLLKEMSR